ncbi:MAG: hypothetical protein JRE23_14045 [Deltaproteobacteria bacterium]|nr:hypothetical protein [Deltaproteobacteria bacterium]
MIIERVENMSCYSKLSKEECRRLRDISSEEHKFLLKKPQYIIGNVVILALVFRFLFTGLGYKVSQVPSVFDVISTILGLGVSLLSLWLLSKWLKFFKNSIVFMVMFSIWVFAWQLLVNAHSGPVAIEPEHLVCAILIFIGWLCSCGSIKEYFIEKIFMSEKKAEGQ